MVTKTMGRPDHSQEPVLLWFSRMGAGTQTPESSLLMSQAHRQVARSEGGQVGLNLVAIWDARVAASG